MARRRMSDLMASAPDLDPEKLDATTEEDIRRYKAAEGYDPGYRPAGPVRTVEAPAEIRARLNMTQEAFARALRILWRHCGTGSRDGSCLIRRLGHC